MQIVYKIDAELAECERKIDSVPLSQKRVKIMNYDLIFYISGLK